MIVSIIHLLLKLDSSMLMLMVPSLVVEFRFGRCQLFRQILVLTFHQLHLGMDVNDSLFVHLPCSGFLSQLPGQELRFFLPLSELLFQLAGHISKGLPEARLLHFQSCHFFLLTLHLQDGGLKLSTIGKEVKSWKCK